MSVCASYARAALRCAASAIALSVVCRHPVYAQALDVDAGLRDPSTITTAPAHAPDGSVSFRAPLAPAEALTPHAVPLGSVGLDAALPAGDQPVAEVTVRSRSEAERLEQSSEAVQVVEMASAHGRTADLGEVLARSGSASVQRSSGLGSSHRITMGGLADEQVPIFIDGVPLALSGYPFGIANVPVNVVERLEVYRGVVPVRMGGDALGGAINLVTRVEKNGTGGSASYQIGSFDTHRLSVLGHHHGDRGLFGRVHGFIDGSSNDYDVVVAVDDATGSRRRPVRRFHDQYRAGGASLEFGGRDMAWARRLSVRAFYTQYARDLQHDVTMSTPYGEVTGGESSYGAQLRYEPKLPPAIRVELVAGYSQQQSELRDVARWRYDWLGRRIVMLDPRGERTSGATDQQLTQHGGFARAHISGRFAQHHRISLTLAPTAVARSGRDKVQQATGGRDPLQAERELVKHVSALEYGLKVLEGEVEGALFVKDYLYFARADEPLPYGKKRSRDFDAHRLGGGATLRVGLHATTYAKASYEYTTRLPSEDEVFGDGLQLIANFGLRPEVAHNGNLGATFVNAETTAGAIRVEVNGFARFVDDLIGRFVEYDYARAQNVTKARALGVETSARWTSVREFLSVDGSFTWQDFRNTSNRGTWGRFDGDRMPNLPWLFANGSVTGRMRGVASAADTDELSLSWNTRYVHPFLRGWESLGARSLKERIPTQLAHSLVLTHEFQARRVRASTAVEAHNLANARLYDVYGVQRPGRALFCKLTLSL